MRMVSLVLMAAGIWGYALVGSGCRACNDPEPASATTDASTLGFLDAGALKLKVGSANRLRIPAELLEDGGGDGQP
jgi:hypothetical protein